MNPSVSSVVTMLQSHKGSAETLLSSVLQTRTIRGFNPTRVRLKRKDVDVPELEEERFNPTRVRLKLDVDVAIARIFDASIPQGFG